MAQYSYLKIQGPFVRPSHKYFDMRSQADKLRDAEFRGIDGTNFSFRGTEMDLMMYLGQQGYRLFQRIPNLEADIFIFEKAE